MTRATGRPRGRPSPGFTRTLGAACLYRELCRRGLTGRQAANAVGVLLGTSRANVQKYQQHPIEPLNEAHDTINALAVLSRYWDEMGRRRWWQLPEPAKCVLRPMVRRLLAESPPI